MWVRVWGTYTQSTALGSAVVSFDTVIKDLERVGEFETWLQERKLNAWSGAFGVSWTLYIFPGSAVPE